MTRPGVADAGGAAASPVDTGSEYTWISASILESLGIEREKKDLAFVMANGRQVTRSVGFAIVHVEGQFTIDEVVFAQDGDRGCRPERAGGAIYTLERGAQIGDAIGVHR